MQPLPLVACKPIAAACGLWFPSQGANPGPLHRECRVLATGPPGKSLIILATQTRGGILAWIPWGVVGGRGNMAHQEGPKPVADRDDWQAPSR